MPDRFAPIERSPWLDMVTHHYGLQVSVFDRFDLIQPNKKYIFLFPRDAAPPEAPTPVTMGLPFLRAYMKTPKLSTAAAMLFGPDMTRNVVDVERPHLLRYLHRHPCTLDERLLQRCTGGHLVVRHRGRGWGVGMLQRGTGTIESMYPKSHALSASGEGPSG